MVTPDSLVQVCDATGANCQWVAVSNLPLLPSLTVEQAQILGGAFVGLMALVWVWKMVRQAT
jgi:hypothetical protein